ncbi:HAD family hydrolase [Candidatus Bathyarchaeota archaeon]|nr:HAD family hydrolase [Candidatus Bathyarchaeota archaeon]
MSLKAVLFDLGGTLTSRNIEDRLVDEGALRSLSAIIASKGYTISEGCLLEEYWRNYQIVNDLRERFSVEIPMKSWLGSLIYRLCDRNIADEVIRIAENHLVEARVNSAALLPGTEWVLETLISKYRLGVVTNTSSERVSYGVIQRLGLNRFFECVVTSAELGIRKPYPGVFHFALREMGVESEEAVFVGNSYTDDVVGSLRAGMRSCFVGEWEEVSERIYEPDAIVDTLSKVPEAVESISSSSIIDD